MRWGVPWARAAHAVIQEPRDAGVFVFAGGCSEQVSVIATDGTVTDAPDNQATSAVVVPSREDALQWAAKIAACRCAQEFR
jgi:hypothetical protein